MADDFNKPNLVISLASSYDQRGERSRAYAPGTTVLNGKDQRKVNFYYEVIQNSGSGNTTLELTKRPGIRTSGKAGGGGTGYTQYCVCNVTGVESSGSWVASTNGTTVSVSNFAGSIGTIASTKVPVYLDKTLISGTATAVIQLRATTGNPPAMEAYYSTGSGWTQINDATFTGLSHVGKIEHLDGYAFQLTYDNKIYNSDLNSVSSWTDGQFLTKQIQQDRAHGLALFKDRILAFGAETVEVFRNVGNPSGSPLISVPELAEKVGMGLLADPNQLAGVPGTTQYYATVLGKMYFVGRRAGPGLLNMGVFVYDGSSFQKISNGAIDRIISDAGTGYIYSICPFAFYGQVAVAIQTSAPGASTQTWLMYFPEYREWFEWNSDVFSPVNDGRLFLAGPTGVSATYWFINASNPDTWQDEGTLFGAMIQFRLPTDGNNRKFMPWCALEADTTTSASNVTVNFSDDDYQSRSTGRTIDLNTPEKRLSRCGSYKNRVVYMTHSDNQEFRIRKFMARVE